MDSPTTVDVDAVSKISGSSDGSCNIGSVKWVPKCLTLVGTEGNAAPLLSKLPKKRGQPPLKVRLRTARALIPKKIRGGLQPRHPDNALHCSVDA